MEKKPGILKVLPKFRHHSSVDSSNLSAKDKRYLQNVEKALLSFESLEEWADYIAFLSRLQKALLLSPEKKHTIDWIPKSSEIAENLSLCLSSKLPNGVHQKALNVYDSIFTSLTLEAFNNEIYLWLPGLLPVLSFGSIQVKSEIIKIFKLHILPSADAANLKIITKALILSFLAGIDDENAESFGDVFELLDTLKRKLEDDGHFWKSMFLAIISNPEKRLGALHWCNKRLPMFDPFKTESGQLSFTEEAKSCIDPNPGLLIRSFATAINTQTVFNPANDIIVVRGFFDLMLTHLPLNSEVLKQYPKEKDLLMSHCIRVLLKKDMSLNRRLWNWLLGPDIDQVADSSKIRASYFEEFGLLALSDVLLERIENSADVVAQINSFKMSLSLILDKWEIGHMLIPRVFYPIIISTFKQQKAAIPKFNDLLSSAQEFFNGVESSYIWKVITKLISSGDLDVVEFILSNFDINEEDMQITHAPLGLMIALVNFSGKKEWFSSVSILLGTISPKGLEPIATEIKHSREEIIKQIDLFYHELSLDEDILGPPFSKSEVSSNLYSLLRSIIIDNINTPSSCELSELFEKLVNMIPLSNEMHFRDEELLSLVLSQPTTDANSSEEEKQRNLNIAFSISKIFHLMANDLLVLEKTRIIKIITSNLWSSLVSSDPAQPQVESVKCLFDLIISSSRYYVEPAISSLISKSNHHDRIKALNCLWSQSNSNETDAVLERSLKLILDELFDESSINRLHVNEFIRTILKSGHSNRLLKMITNPVLDFELMELGKSQIEVDDSLGEFAYHLKTILNVINSNSKNIKEAFNNEFAVMDNNLKLEISKSNEWDISTYKSLMCYVIEKFLSLKLLDDVLRDDELLKDYYNCVSNCLELFSVLVTGNELDFTQKFHKLIENCFYYISLPEIPYQIELVECQYLICIFHMLELSEEARINLNLLHIEDEGREPFLIRFIVKGIQKSQISVLLQQYMTLLTRSLYLFNESVFGVLSILSSAIIDKIDDYFGKIVNKEYINDLVDVETLINELIGGLEDLLSISHSYLLTSRFKNKSDPKAINGQQDSSFLGNVIQGVFQIESPAVRTSEQNKLYAILLAFQDTVRVAFEIWKWADSRSKLEKYSSKESPLGSQKSIVHLGNKLKFRSKKLLESLSDLEKQEVIESLIEADTDKQFKNSIKILNLLDGGRSQTTLPNILNSIMTRCYPSLVDESKRSHLNIPINEKELTRFLIFYFESVDNDAITDIWTFTMQFFKEVLSHHHHFKGLTPNLLRLLSSLSLKLSHSKLGTNKKHKKELSDVFVKLLGFAVSGKRILFGANEEVPASNGPEDNSEEEEDNTPQGVQEELMEAVSELTEHFEEIIQDSEKISSCVNLLVFNLISPQTKNKKIAEYTPRILNILKKIGQYVPNRAWKNMVNDIFMDPNFFLFQPSRLTLWEGVISSWISVDSEKFNEIIVKMGTTGASGAGALFMYNEKVELENKILNLKRLSFLILIQPQDFFLSSLDELFDKIGATAIRSAPHRFQAYTNLLYRAITIKFNELYLLPRWTIINQQLTATFEGIFHKSMKELSFLNEEELQSVLYLCKLLDQLLLLSNDEFNLQEWLFINSTFDVNSNNGDYVISIIDKISKDYDLTILKELPVLIETLSSGNRKIPLLAGVSSIKSIANLRNFFESLSYLNFERVYGLYDIDTAACEEDIKNDLLS